MLFRLLSEIALLTGHLFFYAFILPFIKSNGKLVGRIPIAPSIRFISTFDIFFLIFFHLSPANAPCSNFLNNFFVCYQYKRSRRIFHAAATLSFPYFTAPSQYRSATAPSPGSPGWLPAPQRYLMQLIHSHLSRWHSDGSQIHRGSFLLPAAGYR